MATDMNTILCYMEAIFMKNEKIESLPASELDHLLSKFCLHTCKKNGEEYQPATVSSFQHSIQRYLSEIYCKTRRISRTPSLENQIWEKKTQKRSIVGSKKSSVFLQRKLANNEMKNTLKSYP